MSNLLTAPIFDDEDKTMVARHLFIISWALMAIGWMPLVIAVFIPETFFRWLLVAGYLESVGLILLVLNKYGHTRLVSILLIFFIWAAATGMALTGGGIRSNAMSIYLITVLIAGLVQGGKAGFITAVLCSITGLFLVNLEHGGVLPANMVPHTPFTEWLANTIYMFVIISFQYLVSRTIKKALSKSRQELKERKRVDAALRESEKRYRLIAENTADLISILDMNMNFTYVSPATMSLRGFTVEEAMGQTLEQVLTPESMRLGIAIFEEELQREANGTADPDRTRILELEEYKKDGSIIWVEVSFSFLRDKDNKPFEILIVSRDITERKKDEESLKESSDRLTRAEKTAKMGNWKLMLNTKEFIGSLGAQTIYGAEGDTLSFDDARKCTLPEYIDVLNKGLTDLITKDIPYNLDIKICRPTDGKIIDVHSIAEYDKENNIVYGVIQDITEQKQAADEKRDLQERLNRAEKMEALGTLAGGVAHDLNNVLGIVVGYAEMILDEVEETSPLKRPLVNIFNGGQKAAAIVDDLLTLARRGVPGSNILNLNKIIKDSQQSPELTNLLSHHPAVKIKTDLDSDLLNISGSSVHLNKSLYNLISNACEAMTKGGILTIKTTNHYLDKPMSGYNETKEGDYVVLSISDTGEGISEKDLKRIFEPFYTKKIMGRSGTGLGLAVVWGTVTDHNGYINVQSEEGQGSTFTLYFPVTREEIPTEDVAIDISAYMGNGQSILIVDDVSIQRELATDMLQKLNYNVSCVKSGEEAILYLKDHQTDLIVLDMIMDPGMDGLDTYKSILKINPKQKTIIVSGFSESDRVKEAKRLGAGAYVKKPYIREKLGLAVKKELERAA